MTAYAQTNIQLYEQLQSTGVQGRDLLRVRRAYELALELFAGRLGPWQRPLLSHLVGTASVLCAMDLGSSLMAAGLLHGVYRVGDFGDRGSAVTDERRRRLAEVIGEEAEGHVHALFLFSSGEPCGTASGRSGPAAEPHPGALLMDLACKTEHVLMLDPVRGVEPDAGRMVGRARQLGYPALADDLEETLERVRGRPVPGADRSPPESPILTPRSYSRAW